MPYTLPKIKLTASQIRSAATGALALLVTLNQGLQQVAAAPSLHIPHWLTALIQVVGVVVPMMSRSLDKSRSGTGGGIVGAAPDKAAAATQGGLEPQAPPIQPQAPLIPEAIEAVIGYAESPAAQSLLSVLETNLSHAGKLNVQAVGLDTLSAEMKTAAEEELKALEAQKTNMQGIDQAGLLAGHAVRAAQEPAAASQNASLAAQEAPASASIPALTVLPAAVVLPAPAALPSGTPQ